MAEVSKSTGNYPLMTEDESILSMIDSNLHREKISFSKKAFAYKMKYDVLKKSGRKKVKLTTKQKRRVKTVIESCGLCAGCAFFVTDTENQEIGQRKAKKILLNDGDSQGSKSIGKSGNESIVGFVGEGNEVMKNSVILVEKFDVQNFR